MHVAVHAPAPRNRALDGLRALAVGAVLAYHLFPAYVPGGYLGVDLFFVLSGFLITSLLLREGIVSGRVCLYSFWLRRARRILPAAFTVLVSTCSAALLVNPDLRVNMWQQVLGIVTFSTNWVQIITGGSYFDASIPQLFVHYWSLAVEEQFYLLWPPLLLGLWALSRRLGVSITALVGLAAISMAAGSAALMATGYTPTTDPSALYYGTHTHAFGLLLGATLAAVLTGTHPSPLAARWTGKHLPWHRPAMWNVLTSSALIVFIGACFWLTDSGAAAYRGGIVAVCVAVTVLIAAAALGRSAWAAVLSHPALVWIGQRSYSLYLWHWPVFIITGSLLNSVQARQAGLVPVVTIAVAVILSAISYRLIERPFQRDGFRRTLGLPERHHPTTTPTAMQPRGHFQPRTLRRRTTLTARQAATEAAARGRRHQWRAEAVAATTMVLLALTGLSAFSVTTAPRRTSIEQQLSSSAASHLPPAAPTGTSTAPTPEPPQHRPLPPGEDISVIGDSVALGATQSFVRLFPGLTEQQVNAEVSRSYTAVPGIISGLHDAGIVRPVVILALGANGPADNSYLIETLDEIGPDHLVVVMNAYSPLPANSDINAGIAAAVAGRDNVELGDWFSAISPRPDLLAADQVHPSGQEGQDLYVSTARDALQRLVDRQPKNAPVR